MERHTAPPFSLSVTCTAYQPTHPPPPRPSPDGGEESRKHPSFFDLHDSTLPLHQPRNVCTNDFDSKYGTYPYGVHHPHPHTCRMKRREENAISFCPATKQLCGRGLGSPLSKRRQHFPSNSGGMMFFSIQLGSEAVPPEANMRRLTKVESESSDRSANVGPDAHVKGSMRNAEQERLLGEWKC
jgi:hypothetical protein